MKKTLLRTITSIAMFLIAYNPACGQNTDRTEADLIDLKIDLAVSKLELLQSRMMLLEEKPAALESRLTALEVRITEMESVPGDLEVKNAGLVALEEVQQEILVELNDLREQLRLFESESIAGTRPVPFGNQTETSSFYKPGKHVISMLPVRLFEGTMEISFERVLNKGNALELSAMATYASKKGFARYYLANQKLEYYNTDVADYVSYNSENITGYGGSVTWKNYLLARTDPNYSAPGGPYVAPMGMYRRLTLSGFDNMYNEEEDIYEAVEVIRHLNVFSGGFMAGWQFVFWDVVTADIYLGGMIRLSKYDGEEEFTRYKELQNVDFSGVLPTAGIKLGIVK